MIENIDSIPEEFHEDIPIYPLQIFRQKFAISEYINEVVKLFSEKLRSRIIKKIILNEFTEYFNQQGKNQELIPIYIFFTNISIANLEHDQDFELERNKYKAFIFEKFKYENLYQNLIVKPDYENLWNLISHIIHSEMRNEYSNSINSFCEEFLYKIQKKEILNKDLEYISKNNLS